MNGLIVEKKTETKYELIPVYGNMEGDYPVKAEIDNVRYYFGTKVECFKRASRMAEYIIHRMQEAGYDNAVVTGGNTITVEFVEDGGADEDELYDIIVTLARTWTRRGTHYDSLADVLEEYAQKYREGYTGGAEDFINDEGTDTKYKYAPEDEEDEEADIFTDMQEELDDTEDKEDEVRKYLWHLIDKLDDSVHEVKTELDNHDEDEDYDGDDDEDDDYDEDEEDEEEAEPISREEYIKLFVSELLDALHADK